ncbi:hypothetical protein P3T36_005268 [Kitasatospora sp. MAP12-15]|nr:hypothetical protein [Kitasatospora sp. MAP12-44]
MQSNQRRAVRNRANSPMNPWAAGELPSGGTARLFPRNVSETHFGSFGFPISSARRRQRSVRHLVLLRCGVPAGLVVSSRRLPTTTCFQAAPPRLPSVPGCGSITRTGPPRRSATLRACARSACTAAACGRTSSRPAPGGTLRETRPRALRTHRHPRRLAPLAGRPHPAAVTSSNPARSGAARAPRGSGPVAEHRPLPPAGYVVRPGTGATRAWQRSMARVFGSVQVVGSSERRPVGGARCCGCRLRRGGGFASG